MEHSVWQWIGDGEALQELVTAFPSFVLLIVMAVCILILCKGADLMIDSAVSMAHRIRLPKIVIGATIISLGTTFPEMLVSVVAAWTGNPGLALGNGVGSIICDTGMIFGLMCILTRIPLNRYTLNRTGWVQVGAATLLVVISLYALAAYSGNPVLNRWVGVLFLVLLAGYLYASYYWARRYDEVVVVEHDQHYSLGRAMVLLVLGLVAVLVSSRILVPCAAEGACRIGVPSDIIAATLVAFGTSLPELMTAVTAVRKGHPEIMVGNVVGADVLNCLFVIGAAAMARPLTIQPTFFTFHFPTMLLILYSFRLFIYMNKDGWFKRWQGIWVFSIYVIYIILQYYLNIGTIHR